MAPNVIDTPLGMMSGQVKRSVLEQSIAATSQLVLFLTRSEIKDCEDIIQDEAGRVWTLTNATHYPRMLARAPAGMTKHAFVCSCNAGEVCSKCERKGDREAGVRFRVEAAR